jgi:hypothetical protein
MYIELGRLGITIGEQYTQFIEQCNWYDYEFIKVYVDWEKLLGNFSVQLSLLGFYLDIQYHYKDTKEWLEILKAAEELQSEEG